MKFEDLRKYKSSVSQLGANFLFVVVMVFSVYCISITNNSPDKRQTNEILLDNDLVVSAIFQ